MRIDDRRNGFDSRRSRGTINLKKRYYSGLEYDNHESAPDSNYSESRQESDERDVSHHDERARYERMYHEVFASQNRTQSDLHSSHPTGSSSQGTLRSDDCSGESSSEYYSDDYDDDEWGGNADCMNTLFTRNVAAKMGLISCEKVGQSKKEVQLKMTLPLPSQYMDLMPTPSGLNSAIDSIRCKGQRDFGKKCNYDFDQVEEQVYYEADDRFPGANLPELYRSLFEAPSEASSEDKNEHRSRYEGMPFPVKHSHFESRPIPNERRNQGATNFSVAHSLPSQIVINDQASCLSSDTSLGVFPTPERSSPLLETYGNDTHFSRGNGSYNPKSPNAFDSRRQRNEPWDLDADERDSIREDQITPTSPSNGSRHGLERITNRSGNKKWNNQISDNSSRGKPRGYRYNSKPFRMTQPKVEEDHELKVESFLVEQSQPSFDEGGKFQTNSARLMSSVASDGFLKRQRQESIRNEKTTTKESSLSQRSTADWIPAKKEQLDLVDQEYPSFDERASPLKRGFEPREPSPAKPKVSPMRPPAPLANGIPGEVNYMYGDDSCSDLTSYGNRSHEFPVIKNIPIKEPEAAKSTKSEVTSTPMKHVPLTTSTFDTQEPSLERKAEKTPMISEDVDMEPGRIHVKKQDMREGLMYSKSGSQRNSIGGDELMGRREDIDVASNSIAHSSYVRESVETRSSHSEIAASMGQMNSIKDLIRSHHSNRSERLWHKEVKKEAASPQYDELEGYDKDDIPIEFSGHEEEQNVWPDQSESLQDQQSSHVDDFPMDEAANALEPEVVECTRRTSRHSLRTDSIGEDLSSEHEHMQEPIQEHESIATMSTRDFDARKLHAGKPEVESVHSRSETNFAMIDDHTSHRRKVDISSSEEENFVVKDELIDECQQSTESRGKEISVSSGSRTLHTENKIERTVEDTKSEQDEEGSIGLQGTQKSMTSFEQAKVEEKSITPSTFSSEGSDLHGLDLQNESKHIRDGDDNENDDDDNGNYDGDDNGNYNYDDDDNNDIDDDDHSFKSVDEHDSVGESKSTNSVGSSNDFSRETDDHSEGHSSSFMGTLARYLKLSDWDAEGSRSNRSRSNREYSVSSHSSSSRSQSTAQSEKDEDNTAKVISGIEVESEKVEIQYVNDGDGEEPSVASMSESPLSIVPTSTTLDTPFSASRTLSTVDTPRESSPSVSTFGTTDRSYPSSYGKSGFSGDGSSFMKSGRHRYDHTGARKTQETVSPSALLPLSLRSAQQKSSSSTGKSIKEDSFQLSIIEYFWTVFAVFIAWAKHIVLRKPSQGHLRGGQVLCSPGPKLDIADDGTIRPETVQLLEERTVSVQSTIDQKEVGTSVKFIIPDVHVACDGDGRLSQWDVAKPRSMILDDDASVIKQTYTTIRSAISSSVGSKKRNDAWADYYES